MSKWNDQQPVVSSDTICEFYIGDGMSIELEKVDTGFYLTPVYRYRLTIGSLFASESVLYPYTQVGLENALRTIEKTRNTNGPVEPIGGELEPRETDDGTN
tara:strand:+ start:67 stop:369 length:303 start_codon:yes stop_codon:yes gene_type:complete